MIFGRGARESDRGTKRGFHFGIATLPRRGREKRGREEGGFALRRRWYRRESDHVRAGIAHARALIFRINSADFLKPATLERRAGLGLALEYKIGARLAVNHRVLERAH